MSKNNKSMLKILLLGEKLVGKTSLAYRYINGKYICDLKTTIGEDQFTKALTPNGTLVSLQTLDTTGLVLHDPKSTAVTPCINLYRSADCCIFVFDVTCRDSFESLKTRRIEFFMLANKEKPNEFPVAVVGNKIDLESKRKVSKQEAQDWCKSFSIPYFECSSKDDINVQQVFEAMTAKLVDTHKL
ncbi:ras-related protein Rab-7a-like [Drosophila nasuta]|uniref:ras-related protein Rab-7a-like n=1 Tax=Drosophila nasuta TaxID=42062 RepID=UPI00295ED0D0|nr:ras-related protein Rab-7a-like [Drosophila nasuta]